MSIICYLFCYCFNNFFKIATVKRNTGGSAVSGVIATYGGGYSFVAPLFCGEQLLKQVWDNAEGQTVIASRIKVILIK